TASNTLQQTLGSLYETIPFTPEVSGYNESLVSSGQPPTIVDPNPPHNIIPNPDYYTPFWIPTPLPANPPITTNPIVNPNPAPQYYYTLPSNISTNINTPNPPTYFASQSALEALAWAQAEIGNAYTLAYSNNYTMAVSQLNMAVADLDSAAVILQDAVDNPQSGMGNTAPFLTDNNTWSFLLSHPQDSASANILDLRRTIGLLKQREADIQAVQGAIADNSTDAAGPLFQDLFSQMQPTSSAVYSDVNFIKVYYTYPYPFQDISSYFYAKAQDSLNKTLDSSQTGAVNSIKFYENLTLARHYMELCNSFLGSNEIDLQHGLSQPNEQNFKVNLAKNAVGLENANQALLNSIIIAPVDGIVVSVGIKANDQLSNQTYSSVSAFMVVDTSNIQFKGLVDEIDISKVKTGQKVNISVDAVPNKTFTGVVSFISPYGTTVGNVVKYNVTILLDHSDVALKGGLSATADIAVDTLKDVLVVPITALTTTAAGSTVNLLDPKTGVSTVKKVTLGIQNLQYAQITSGLNEGDQLSITLKSSATIITSIPGPGQQSTQQSGGGGGPPPR
ncbi:MAG: HlyD family efflux transporter periplasmic adaptor subunit, partial [Dehalococcoidia bacterium]